MEQRLYHIPAMDTKIIDDDNKMKYIPIIIFSKPVPCLWGKYVCCCTFFCHYTMNAEQIEK